MVLQRIFSRRVGYAIHALCLLANKQPLSATPVASLAWQMAQAWPNASATYLSKVVQALVQGGILVSLRGSAGGYGFSRPPAELSLLDVVNALEGPLDASCPLKPSGPCKLAGRCPNYRVLLTFQNHIAQLLSEITLERLASDLPKLESESEQDLGCEPDEDAAWSQSALLALTTIQPALLPATIPTSLPLTPSCSGVVS